ncbi:hypothetical protein M422DRAFT_276570 [Sphaerobolus stellatus SS14]|uniref:Endonuclease/exonuclease/phosphatase domain-containing protein n=1 Tax=Sphaerobolus stellatus (strain SS14) TaxID=990650 RepID=A0A0C9U1R0_SPHS4|nr:hypothetical protein M422DRAFT_276570 [Sphaerobolus stellatus SS14]
MLEQNELSQQEKRRATSSHHNPEPHQTPTRKQHLILISESPTADCPPISKAGTICPASDRSPFEHRDLAKKPKAVDLEEYLNEDIDLPPSPTHTTTRSATLLGADILGDTSTRKEPSTLSDITIPHLPSTSSMSQSGSTTAPADTTTQVSPQDQAIVGSSDTDHHPVTTYALNPPPPGRLPADIRNRFITPVGTGWYPIHGQTLERLMFPITPNHQHDWKSLDGNKTLAVISRLKVTHNAADRVAAMSALERLLAMAFPGNAAIDIVLGDTIQAHVHPNSAYPFLVQGLTDRETRILKNEFVLAHEDIAVFFYPYDTALPITNYVLSLEGLVLTPSSANDTRAAAELVRFLSTAGEFIQFINQNHSNIPFDTEPNPSNFSVAHSDDACKYTAVPGQLPPHPLPPLLPSPTQPKLEEEATPTARAVAESLDVGAAATRASPPARVAGRSGEDHHSSSATLHNVQLHGGHSPPLTEDEDTSKSEIIDVQPPNGQSPPLTGSDAASDTDLDDTSTIDSLMGIGPHWEPTPDDGPPWLDAPGPQHQIHQPSTSRKKLRGGLRIASQDIQGGRKIGILALQETHIDDRHLESISRLFDNQLIIFNSSTESNSTSCGTAFMLNKRLVRWQDVSTQEIIPGRALLLSIPGRDPGENSTLNVLNIYAPNNPQENATFWSEIRTIWHRKKLKKPNIMLGDFNLVEDSSDKTLRTTIIRLPRKTSGT